MTKDIYYRTLPDLCTEGHSIARLPLIHFAVQAFTEPWNYSFIILTHSNEKKLRFNSSQLLVASHTVHLSDIFILPL